MNRTNALDRAYGLLLSLCDDADPASPATCDLLDAFNLVAELHVPTVIASPARHGLGQRLHSLEHLLIDLADSAVSLSDYLTLRDAVDLVRRARSRLQPNEARP